MKNLYVSAWFLLAAAALVSALTGGFTPVAMVVFSLITLELIFALLLWSVIVNSQETETE